MKNKIYKKDDNLIIEIPLIAHRYNPLEDKIVGEMLNIIAIIDTTKDEPEIGFAYRIDMSYKGKDDQWTDLFYKWFDEQEEFERLCKELGIDIVFIQKVG